VVDLNALAPSEMGRLLGKPEGEVGRAVGEMLNRVNAGITAAVYRSLRLEARDRVLEIGFGNGKLLPALLSCADDLSYAGVDIAETMVGEASAFNADLIAGGRASFRLASAEALPFADASFDKVFAVNVIYFWQHPVRALAEIRRVLRPGGMSSIASAVSRPGEPPPPFAREEYGFHRRDPETLVALHREAGFGHVDVDESYQETVTLPDGVERKRSYAIILARP
jgi:ubiquinone/menaquinone biosynthesis C-methylase UbiE